MVGVQSHVGRETESRKSKVASRKSKVDIDEAEGEAEGEAGEEAAEEAAEPHVPDTWHVVVAGLHPDAWLDSWRSSAGRPTKE
jgi:hypothetical protein